jgi:hypothetical protein
LQLQEKVVEVAVAPLQAAVPELAAPAVVAVKLSVNSSALNEENEENEKNEKKTSRTRILLAISATRTEFF